MKADQPYRNDLLELLDRVRNAKRVYRDQAADAILRRPELLPALVETIYDSDRNYAVRAAWVLELVCLYEIRLLIPFTAEFAGRLKSLKDESSIRPVSKICSLISKQFCENPWEPFDPESKWINELISSSFEWLTGEHKVAAQVFAMESLFIWGQKYDWIFDELHSILDLGYSLGSKGYRSRARKIMDKISAAKRMKGQK